MPAVHYTVRWSDALETVCYSPSLIVEELLVAGTEYPIDEFLDRVRRATTIANERVRAKYGFACARATDQLARLESLAAHRTGRVTVLGFRAAE